MRYMGGKFRMSNDIKNIVDNLISKDMHYIEPFCGGCNVIFKINPNIKRVANDTNKYLISMWAAIQNGWEPPDHISEELYKDIKSNKDKYPPELVGFAGFGSSFGGVFFGGYARCIENTRRYCIETKNAISKQIKSMKDVIFSNCDYKDLKIENKSLIYCDPPYKGFDHYGFNFDSNDFYQWCRDRKYDGHTVIVSEYSAPEDFDLIFEKKIKVALSRGEVLERVERIYKV